jgi:peptide/nickel transport system substrate-binding protein
VKIYMTANPRSLGYPATAVGPDMGVAAHCLDALFAQDALGNVTPLLATGYKLDPAAKTMTITLRKGVKFHDGSDFNAAICKWNLDLYRTSA